MNRDWKEEWIDRMGLIVALGPERFEYLARFKNDMNQKLTDEQRTELRQAIKMRFTPSNGLGGCESGTTAVKEATE